MQLLHSEAVLALLGLAAVYCGMKLLSLVLKLWTPKNRAMTLDEKQLGKWRVLASLEALSLLCLFLGLLLGLAVNSVCFLLAAAGAVAFMICKALLMKKFPYIDPATVKKSGKKKKK